MREFFLTVYLQAPFVTDFYRKIKHNFFIINNIQKIQKFLSVIQ